MRQTVDPPPSNITWTVLRFNVEVKIETENMSRTISIPFAGEHTRDLLTPAVVEYVGREIGTLVYGGG